MLLPSRRTWRLLFVGMMVLGGLVALTAYLGSSPATADDQDCGDGRRACPNVACVSACWYDGTVPAQGKRAKQTIFYPPECEFGPGCATQNCQ